MSYRRLPNRSLMDAWNALLQRHSDDHRMQIAEPGCYVCRPTWRTVGLLCAKHRAQVEEINRKAR
jgi:hypothetical protein